LPQTSEKTGDDPKSEIRDAPYSVEPDQRDGNDAICFTPGFPGACFGAGTIHAYLAADRKPPRVAAGISLGTVSAAVMQRSYADLIKAKNDRGKDSGPLYDKSTAARWSFFRKYIQTISDRPFQVIWKGIPDPADFFAELPPIRDPVPDTIEDSTLRKDWKKEELAARKELYLLVKLGHWLAKSPVRVSAIANTIVSFVRAREKYPLPKPVRWLQYLVWQSAVVISFILHVVRAPSRFPDYKFAPWKEDPKTPKWKSISFSIGGWIFKRPLFGWPVYLSCSMTVAVLQLVTANLARYFLSQLGLRSPVLFSLVDEQLAKAQDIARAAGWIAPCCSALHPSGNVIGQPWHTSILLAAFSFGLAILFLFLTTSLATWWIPMKGRFPYRVVPMICSVTSVSVLTLFLYSRTFQAWLESFSDWKTVRHLEKLFEGIWFLANDPNLQHRRVLCVLLMHPLLFLIVCAIMIAVVVVALYRSDSRDRLIRYMLRQVAMEKHLVHDYYLRYALTSLFGKNGNSPELSTDPFPLVLVASPLQRIGVNATLNNQLWANTAAPAPKLVQVLRATLAVPGLLDPYVAKGREFPERNGKEWYNQAGDLERLDMVDGSVVRQNPLPALFNFIRRNYEDKRANNKVDEAIAKALKSKGPSEARVHVVYNVPAQAGEGQAPQKVENVVDVAFLSLRLAKRRDINMEIDQTNFISALAHQIDEASRSLPGEVVDELNKTAPPDSIFPIFADHIAPTSDLSFRNPIAPKRDEVLKIAAAGCKATLEQLYAIEIAANGRNVGCKEFLSALRRSKDASFAGEAGLPEICDKCDGCLQARPDAGKKAVFDHEEVQSWSEQRLDEKFPQLTSRKPRIVFIASGGVFRGPFHAGMINAMLALKIKPDLIMGASVGTLVGAALAATLAAPSYKDSLTILDGLVETFQQMDERIAFTQTLKNAAREVGIRSRMVELSPSELRMKILEGTRADPGFAATGTPPVLIDALADILLIPHGDTSRIAAQFVAGHFTDAMRRLVRGLRKETLRRLDIVEAVMGASLIEPAARRLLGSHLIYNGKPWYDMTSRQPYQNDGIAIFGTSTDLVDKQPVLLGRYLWQLPSYDFLNACLASSAFPAVFAPRTEEQIFPGLGRPDKLYSDGGMFDNLPITPSLEILTASQKQWIPTSGLESIEAFGKRNQSPDLFIAGSLEVDDESGAGAVPHDKSKFETSVAIKNRASALQKNLKIKAYEALSEQVSEHFLFLEKLVNAQKACGAPINADYLNGLVNSVLLPVYPTDQAHLNGTFQFCSSLGRKLEVINQSMADGCFRTLRELAIAFSPQAKPNRSKTVWGLAETNPSNLPVLVHQRPSCGGQVAPENRKYVCPFYAKYENKRRVEFHCPFSETDNGATLFETCIKDRKHKDVYKSDLVQIAKEPSPSSPG